MVDIFAALVRFRQFIFEFGPFLLAAWAGLALSTGLLTLVLARQTKVQASANSLRRGKFWHWIWQFIFLMLWRPGGQMPAQRAFNAALLFGLAVPIPSLVATSLIDVKAVLLRLALTVLFSLSLGWLLNLTVLPKPTEPQGRLPEAGLVSIVNDNTSSSQPASPFSIIQVGWKSFTGQVNAAVLPLLAGFALASALTVYVPAYWIRPWLGEGAWSGPFLTALIATPFQLSGGAEVVLASALLTKGASLGSALSTMLVAPITTFSVIRHFFRPVKIKTVALYLVAAWFVAGSLGVAIDAVQQLLK